MQSGRVVDFLEGDGAGLNLTREVVDGIINHKQNCNPKTLEGKAVSLADRIAYINHDIDDAIDGGFITFDELPQDLIAILGKTSSKRINTMIFSIFKRSEGENRVEMEPEIAEATAALRAFLLKGFTATILSEKKKSKRSV